MQISKLSQKMDANRLKEWIQIKWLKELMQFYQSCKSPSRQQVDDAERN
jgi:hypothetical protein